MDSKVHGHQQPSPKGAQFLDQYITTLQPLLPPPRKPIVNYFGSSNYDKFIVKLDMC